VERNKDRGSCLRAAVCRDIGTHPRLADRERVKRKKVRKKELDAAKKAKKKAKKQEKVDKNKRARERKAANLRDFFVGPIGKGITPRGAGCLSMRRDLYVTGTFPSLIADRIIVHVKSEVFKNFL
jgi:hypothetical protein